MLRRAGSRPGRQAKLPSRIIAATVRPAMLVGVLGLLLIVGPISGAGAAAFTVNSTADARDVNPGDGQCRTATGTCTLRAAIQEANALGAGPHTISLAADTFTLTRFGSNENAALTGDLDVTSNVTITGTFGDELGFTRVRGTSGWDDRIFDVHPGASLTLNTLAVQNGRTASGAGIFSRNGGTLSLNDSFVENNAAGAGGGILNAGSLTVEDTRVSGNEAFVGVGAGGGINNLSTGVATVSNSSVELNDAGIRGGGIANAGSLTITSTTISGNTAPSGGGIANSGTLTATNTTVSGNTAASRGGGLANTGTGTLATSRVTSNNGGASGGGLDNSGSLTVRETTISGNTAAVGGGIANGLDLTLLGSTISGNTATAGGGISTLRQLTAADVTVSGNSAREDGGGIVSDGVVPAGVVTVNNLTITENVADSDQNGSGNGGGVRIVPPSEGGSQGGSLSLGNTILGRNFDRSPTTRHPDCSGALTSRGFNLISNANGCTITGTTTGNLNGVNPALRPLADNGGPTFTHALATLVEELGFVILSPAVDRGSTSVPGSGGSACADFADQRGFSRPVDGNGDGRARCDIGAFEHQGSFDLGTFSLAPEEATVGVGEHVTYTFSWTVPGPSWRTLATLDLRVRDDEEIPIWVRFKEISGKPGTFSLVNPKSGKVGRGFAPGAEKRLETEAAVLHLAGSSVDGPPGPRVTLTLELSFKRQASGRSYDVEVLAVDDAGAVQGFAPGGRLTVVP